MNVKNAVQDTAKKVATMVRNIPKYWNKPKEGEYVSNKEFTAFVVGAAGSSVAGSSAGQLSFSASCLFVGAIYGLKMMDFVMLGIVGSLLNYLFQPVGMIITDNLGRPPKKTMRWIWLAIVGFIVGGVGCMFVPQQYFEGFMPALPQVVGTRLIIQGFGSIYNIAVMRWLCPKFGKYRCWVIANTLPSVITLLLVTWFPYNGLDYHTKFWVMNALFSLWGWFGSCFGQTNNLQNVISPNTEERTKIMSFGMFLYSIGPTIFNAVFPALATLAGGMTSLKTYRIVIPALVLVSAPLCFFFAFGVKERVIQEQEHKPQVGIFKGAKEVLRNKYLWITNVSQWLGSFQAGVINITNMLIIYSMRKDWFIGVLATIIGTAWTPGMLLAPWLIKKMGKKKLVLLGKYLFVACSLLQIAGVYIDSFVIIVIASYISTMLSSAISIATTAMTADIWDYQQYISGERLDASMGIFTFISNPITMFTAMLVPFLYGLVGFTSDWNILYDAEIRTQVLLITAVVGTAAGLVNIIPYHFYDLTEEKHKGIIEELKKRAGIEKEPAEELVNVQTGTEE